MKRHAMIVLLSMALLLVVSTPARAGTIPGGIDLTVDTELQIKGWMKGVQQTITIDLGSEYYEEVTITVHIFHEKNPHADWEYFYMDTLDGSMYDLTVVIERARHRPAGLYYIEIHFES